jgi:hypothetical protein
VIINRTSAHRRARFGETKRCPKVARLLCVYIKISQESIFASILLKRATAFRLQDCQHVHRKVSRIYDLHAMRRHAIHLIVLVIEGCMRKFDKFKLLNNQRLSRVVQFVSFHIIFLFNFVQMAEFSTPTKVKCKSRINNSEFCTPVKTSTSSIQIPASPFLEKIGYGTGMFIYFKRIFLDSYLKRSLV